MSDDRDIAAAIDSSRGAPAETAIEPERYEFRAPAVHHFDLQRRDFFKFLGAGLLVACALKTAAAQESSAPAAGGFAFGPPLPKEISAWLHISEKGVVTV